MTSDDENLDDVEEHEPVIIPSGDELIPDCAMEPSEVANLQVPYSTRAAGDWVISGPIGDFPDTRGGRRFDSWETAEVWAQEKYGKKFKGRVGDLVNSACNRWGFLIGQIV